MRYGYEPPVQSNMKVALDFVTPEGISPTFTQSQRLRQLPNGHRFKEDRLQVRPLLPIAHLPH